MTASASAQNHLFNTLREQLGDEDAATLMDALPLGGWDEVATKTDLRSLRSEMLEGFAEVRGEIAKIQLRMTEFATRAEVGEIVEAKVAIAMRSQLYAFVGLQIATIGGIIAAIRL